MVFAARNSPKLEKRTSVPIRRGPNVEQQALRVHSACLCLLDPGTPLSSPTSTPVSMPGHKPPTDPSPLVATLLSDDTFDSKKCFGELRSATSAACESASAASSSALLLRSRPADRGFVHVQRLSQHFDRSSDATNLHIEHASSDAVSDNTLCATLQQGVGTSPRTAPSRDETSDHESDTASDFSDEDVWRAEPTQPQSYETQSLGQVRLIQPRRLASPLFTTSSLTHTLPRMVRPSVVHALLPFTSGTRTPSKTLKS
jgi:hypothetical protein